MPFTQKEQKIFDWGLDNGKSRQEVERAIFKLRSGFEPAPQAPTAQDLGIGQFQDSPFEGGRAEPTLIEEVKESANVRADRVGDILDRPVSPQTTETLPSGRQVNTSISPTLTKGVQIFGQGAGLAADAFEGAISRIPIVDKAFEAVGKGIQAGAEGKYSPLRVLGEYIGGNSEALQEAVILYDNDQEFKDTIDAVANIVRLGGDVTLAEQAVGLPTKALGKINALKAEAQTTVDIAKGNLPDQKIAPAVEAVTGKVDDIITNARDFQTSLQTSLAGKGVNPTLETSAQRLQDVSNIGSQGKKLKGTAGRINDPVALYDDFLQKAKNAASDEFVDQPLGQVGEEIGNAFDGVVKMRQGVGKNMSAERTKVGDTKTDISGVADDFAIEISSNAGRIAPSNIKVLEIYEQAVIALGKNPTIAQIDDFLVRQNDILDVYKGNQNITKVTNFERIIKGNMSKLREQFDPVKTKNPDLQAYADARAQYSELTNFVKEGERFLGKRTQSGDYARDASVAKSAVQSILDSGKKDWLLALEGHTGYQAVDRSVLALQAMKDAGVTKGRSLLEMFADQPAITPTGIMDKVSGFLVEQGKRAVVGTPEEQTRLFLQSLK